MSLSKKHCLPCTLNTRKFNRKEAEKYLSEIKNWQLEGNFTPEAGDKISKNYSFKNFKDALAFINKVGDLAEQQNHHPNILIHSWNKVRLEIYTHKNNGLTQNDFILAKKIDGVT